jgi:carboxymethylenebutenolidase
MDAISHVSIPVQEGQLPLTVARGKGTGAAVILIPSAFGVAPDVERQLTEIADYACLAVAMDLLFREDPGYVPYDDMPRISTRFKDFNRERCRQDVLAVVQWVQAHADGKPIVGVGVCMGGPTTLRLAAEGLIQGVVTWHGSAMETFLDRASEMRCPMRHHFGAEDPVTKPETIEAIRKAFAGRDDVRFFVHEGATHGFSHPDAQVYQEKAERAGMASVKELVTG